MDVAELFAVDFFDRRKSGVDLILYVGADDLAVVIVARASLGGNSEALRDGHPEPCHFRKVGSLAAKQLLHGPVALAEQINILVSH